MVLDSKFCENVKKLIKIKDVTIDGMVFNLHCKITALMMLCASSMVSMKMYVGEPIQCIAAVPKDRKEELKVIETFCWVNSTFTLAKEDDSSEKQVYYAYYQWICFILFFQGLIFYAPKWMWKHYENNLMKHLQGDDTRKLEEKEKRLQKKKDLVNYFYLRLKLQVHKEYAITYWCYELVCWVNVATQMWVLNRFFTANNAKNNDSYSWVVDVVDLVTFKFPDVKAMEQIFPLMTKCTFHKYGPGGSVELHDALCILGLNSYNRYIFLVMWYWLFMLLVLLTLLFLYRMMLVLSSSVRCVLLKTPGKNDRRFETKFVVHNLSVCDWWVLYMVKNNVDPILFEGVILELFKKLCLPRMTSMESEKMLSEPSATN